MLKSMYTIISAVVAAIGAYALCKYTKWNYFNTFAGLVIAAYAMQVARFLFVNYAHFFGRFH